MSINDLTEEEKKVYMLAVTKKSGWHNSDCPFVRSNPVTFKKAWEKAAKNGATFDSVQLAAQAQAISRRRDRQAGSHVPQPMMIERWLNECNWGAEIVSDEPEKHRHQGKLCQCGQETYGPQFDKCSHCMDWKDGRLRSDCPNRQWLIERLRGRVEPIILKENYFKGWR